MHTYWTTRLMAIGASTILAASLLPVSPASARYRGYFCSAESINRANYTWADGTFTTKVYYNNHCGRKFKVRLNFITKTGQVVSKCWRTPAGKSYRVWPYSDLNDMDKGC